MNTKIDWLSFSLEIDEEPTIALQGEAIARKKLRDLSPEHYSWIFNGAAFDFATSRAPYKYCFRRIDGGVSIYIGSNTNTVLYEVTGRGCEPLAELSIAQQCIQAIVNRISRIDIAVDMLCDERPAEFVNRRAKSQGMSLGFQKSPTGETVYLGSQKSDRYCRVYRYEHPHPRSSLLRFEAVYRRDFAKALAWSILDADFWEQVTKTVGERYGWQSENWQPGIYEPLNLQLPRTNRNEDKTATWLYKTVAPSIAKMVVKRALDPEDFKSYINKCLVDLGWTEDF